MSRALFGRVRMTGGGSAGTGPGGQFRWLGTEAPFEARRGGPGPSPLPSPLTAAWGPALPHHCGAESRWVLPENNSYLMEGGVMGLVSKPCCTELPPKVRASPSSVVVMLKISPDVPHKGTKLSGVLYLWLVPFRKKLSHVQKYRYGVIELSAS